MNEIKVIGSLIINNCTHLNIIMTLTKESARQILQKTFTMWRLL